MTLAIRRNKIALLLLAIILTRTISEVMQTYVFEKANYIWSLMFVFIIPFIVLPLLLLVSRRDSNIFIKYGPVFAYLGFLIIRTSFSNWYSMKCTLSEIVVWVCYVFTMEVCAKDRFAAQNLQGILIFIGKAVTIFGCIQMLFFLLIKGHLNFYSLWNGRPVNGIFEHPSAYLICLFPFLLYFLKNRVFFWTIVAFLTCVFTGTRAPFLALICVSYLAYKAIFNKEITAKDIIISLIMGLIIYSVLISMNTVSIDYSNYDARNNFASLQWRIAHWRKFLEFDDLISFVIGHGVGAADKYPGRGGFAYSAVFLPHNDYLRIFWDTGVVGLCIFLNMLIFNLKVLFKKREAKNSFVILTYLVVIFFYITDNFIYFTYPIFVYMFIGSFANAHAAEKENYVQEKTRMRRFVASGREG